MKQSIRFERTGHQRNHPRNRNGRLSRPTPVAVAALPPAFARIRRSRYRLGRLVPMLVALLVIGICARYIHQINAELPTRSMLLAARSNINYVVDADVNQLRVVEVINPFPVRLASLPKYIKEELIASEDRRFGSHPGVDVIGIITSIKEFASGGPLRGAGTIAMQLARSLALSPDVSLDRKIREALLALRINDELTAQEILEAYLNRANFGSGCYGIEAAARYYFNKHAFELSALEAAMLIRSLPSPAKFNPRIAPQIALQRGQDLISRMRLPGSALSRKLLVSSPPLDRISTDSVGIFDQLRPELQAILGHRQGRFVVTTTIDSRAEHLAEYAMNTQQSIVRARGGDEGALLSLSQDGAVTAMVPSFGRDHTTMCLATQGQHQIGSTAKLFVFLAALESGKKPDDVISGAPITIGDWSPKNDDYKYPRRIRLADALARSCNSCAVRLIHEVGVGKVVDLAKRMGLRGKIPAGAGFALGEGETSLANLTATYAVLANNGHRVSPYFVRWVHASDGRTVYWKSSGAELASTPSIVRKEHAQAMRLMLHQVVNKGTGRGARLAKDFAYGKTGTSQENRNAWFIGGACGYTTGVWFGRLDGGATTSVSGPGVAAPAWKRFMANWCDAVRSERTN